MFSACDGQIIVCTHFPPPYLKASNLLMPHYINSMHYPINIPIAKLYRLLLQFSFSITQFLLLIISPSHTRSTMNFEIESPFSFPIQSSSPISQSSPCTAPNNNPNLISQLPSLSQLVSHKRKGGRKKFKETRHPIYRGVRQRKGKWVCELREPKKTTRIWLGTYPTPEMAARAHDVGALAIRGTSAILNFPNSVSLLPIANSLSSRKDIRAAAVEAAESLRPISNSHHKKISRKSKSTRAKKVPSLEETTKETVLDSSLHLKSMHSLLDREKCDVINSVSSTEKQFGFLFNSVLR